MRLKGLKTGSKFTLQRAKLPQVAREQREPTPAPTAEEYTQEDYVYTRMLEANPILGELVQGLDLILPSTGERPKRVLTWGQEEPQKSTFTPQPVGKPQQRVKRLKKENIEEFTARILEGYNSYSREEIMERIKQDAGVDDARAFKGFIKMRKERVIYKTQFHTYYLGNSTPF